MYGQQSNRQSYNNNPGQSVLFGNRSSPIPGQQQPQNHHSNNSSSNHIQRQIDRANLARASASPHHHARLAIAAQRQTQSESPEKSSDAKLEPLASEWTSLDLGGMQVKNISPSLYLYTFLTSLYLNHNRLTLLDPRISLLTSLTILDLSGNGLREIPRQIGLLSGLKEFLMFDNDLRDLPSELGFLYQLKELGIEGNPIAAMEPYPTLMQKEGTVAIVQYLRDNCPVGQPPPEREWIALDEDDNQDSYTILCYNTLCDKYATPQSYAYTPSWVLSWEYRRELVMQEILNYNADIVCLQEVEYGEYEDYFQAQMSLHGEYDSLFYPKSRARTMDEYSRKAVDGCATFWKTNKFSLVEKHLIEFQQIAMQRPELRKTEDVYNRVMIKDNIAVLTLLESKDTHAARIIVANAHLHWDPNYKDVKLVQTAMLVEELGQMANTWSGLSSRHPTHAVYAANPLKLPVIIAGDFNSMPSSGVYEFLSTGVIRQDHDDFGTYKYGKYTTDGLYCRTAFKSAYSHIQEEPHEGGGGDGSELPPGAIMWTNYTPGFRGVIDYVWYGTAGVSVTGVLAGVDRGYAEGVVGFPNWHHPSDHIPLVVGFRIKSVL